MSQSGMYCFGYGSLVNRKTHDFDRCEPCVLSNWRRRWCHRTNGRISVTSLSIERHEGVAIEGLLAWVSEDRITPLDKRESGYSKHLIQPEHLNGVNRKSSAPITYITDQSRGGDAQSPILQSYLDAVLSGFLAEFGELGVRQFVDSTAGWDTPILKDRIAPFYPRSVTVTPDEADFFDAEVRRINGSWIDLDSNPI